MLSSMIRITQNQEELCRISEFGEHKWEVKMRRSDREVKELEN